MKSHVRILAALLAAIACQPAFAFDGTINSANVGSTCVVTDNRQVAPTPALVILQKQSAALLKTTKTVAGQTGSNIQLSVCTGTTTTAAAYVEAGPGVDTVTLNVKSSGTAKLVQLQLIENNGV